MKKEVFLAITIGFVLGLIITFGIWTANNSLKNLPAGIQTSPTSVPSGPTPTPVSPTPESDAQIPLSITSPVDESLVNKTALKITGVTSPSAVVALVYETGEQLVSADAKGEFSADISLEGGYNLITVTAYNATGQSTTQTLTITYTTSAI